MGTAGCSTRKKRPAWPLLSPVPVSTGLNDHRITHTRLRFLGILGLAFAALMTSSSAAVGLVPRVAVCGRVTSFVDAAPPADRIVKLGTQEPRRLSLGSQVPQIG
jgi:hypothetical protein